MYKYIEQADQFSDLKTINAKNNYMRIMNCLDNITIPNIPNRPHISLSKNTLNKENFNNHLEYLCSKVFLDENTRLLAKDLINNRMELDFNGYPFGYTSNDINENNIISVEGCKYSISPIVTIHELTHTIGFINKASIPKQYEEILSIFNEIRACHEMEENVQNEWLFNKIIQRLKYRVYLKDLTDEEISSTHIDKDLYFNGYSRILDLVYALRLYELYCISPEEISKSVNRVLNNEISILELLEKNQISLDNEDTIVAFEKVLEKYEQVVRSNFNKDKCIRQ